MLPKIKFRARKLQLDWWFVTSAKTRGLQRVGKKLVLITPVPAQGLWIDLRCQTWCQCVTCATNPCSWGLFPHPEQSPWLGQVLWWQSLPENPREAEKATRESAACLKNPKEAAAMESAWGKAATISVPKKANDNSQQVKPGKPKKTAQSLSWKENGEAKAARTGMRSMGRQCPRKGEGKAKGGFDWASVSPKLAVGGRQLTGRSHCRALWLCPPQLAPCAKHRSIMWCPTCHRAWWLKAPGPLCCSGMWCPPRQPRFQLIPSSGAPNFSLGNAPVTEFQFHVCSMANSLWRGLDTTIYSRLERKIVNIKWMVNQESPEHFQHPRMYHHA